jgi:hypothetical protein
VRPAAWRRARSTGPQLAILEVLEVEVAALHELKARLVAELSDRSESNSETKRPSTSEATASPNSSEQPSDAIELAACDPPGSVWLASRPASTTIRR